MSTPALNSSSTDSQMHNNIMAAGSNDRPPMLGPGRFLTVGGSVFFYAAEGRPAVQQHTAIETVLNMTPENKEHFLSEKEAIFLLLTGIGDEIYSTVDACNTANEMWIAIERLQQGESLNVQDVKTNLFWEFGKFTSRDGESMESYYSRFYKLMNELTRNNLQVTTMQVNVFNFFNIFYHKYSKMKLIDPVAERIAKSANPLALLTATQQYSDNLLSSTKISKIECTIIHAIFFHYDMRKQNDFKAIKEIKRFIDSRIRKKCKTNLDETNSALGEAISCRDSCLIALQNKQNEFEKYKAFNDRTIDYEILQTKLNETLGLLALKDIEIKEEHKVISDLKVKEEKDIDKMIEMDKQLKFLNELYLKKPQSEKPCLYEIPFDTSDPGKQRFAPDRKRHDSLITRVDQIE
ncbi:hypothetical protein Tco_0883876 [Tanacetum coccineum]